MLLLSIGRGKVILRRIVSPVSARILWSRLSQQIVHPHLRHQSCITVIVGFVLFGEAILAKSREDVEDSEHLLGRRKNVTVKQPARAGHGDHVTATAVLNARNTDWTRHSPPSCRTSRTRVRSVGCTLFMLICFRLSWKA